MKGRSHSSLVVLASVVAIAAACTVAPEEKILRDFFRSSRLRDTMTLATFATTSFDPRTDGQVQSFKVVDIGAERSTPLPVHEYAEAIEVAREAERAFSKEKMAYQNANLRAIERVIEAERKRKLISRRDAAVQTAWAKWRADAAQHAKAVSEARMKLQSLRGIVELTMSTPNGPTPDIEKLDGELVEKDVTVRADVRTAEGQSAEKTLVVTLVRGVMREGSGEPQMGRWIVRRVRAADAQPTT